jgi:hypothetical protein
MLLTELRRHVNESQSVRWHLFRNSDRWLRVTSALDIAEDTCEAIDTYQSLSSEQTLGLMYLAIYGLLQCMYVQQDALLNLFNCFKGLMTPGNQMTEFRWKDYPEWKLVRTVRNEVAGHPAETWKPSAVHGIVRIDLSICQFSYHSSFLSGKMQSQEVDTRQLIESQRVGDTRLLRSLVAAADSAHESYLDALAGYNFGNCFSTSVMRKVESLFYLDLSSEIQEIFNLLESHCRMLKRGLNCLHTDYRVFPGIRGALENVLQLVRSTRQRLKINVKLLDWESVAQEILADVKNLHECVNEFKLDQSRLRDSAK